MSNKTISAKCATFVSELSYAKLPDDVKQRAKDCLIDFVACTIGGFYTPEGEMITEYAQENKESQQATIIGNWSKNSVYNAALANAYNCHILECDDIHKSSVIHGAAPIIAAALAVAEKQKSTGEELIEAIVAGYEVAFRVGEAVMPSHYSIWHNTATCGGFGSAAAVGKLLKLNEEQLVDAIGNAGTQASGLWEFLSDNAMSKYLHCGRAACNGFLAATLAKKGVTGAKRIIEGPQGFVAATSKEQNPESKFEDLGVKYKIMENGFKPYATCRHIHSTIDAVLHLKKQHGFTADDVKEVNVNVYRVATEVAKNNVVFPDARSAKFSIVYCATVALCYGAVSVDYFTVEYLKNEKLLDFAKKFKVNVSEELTKEYPKKWMSNVVIEKNDGEILEYTVDYPKGDAENPFTEEDFKTKFLDLSEKSIGKDKANTILEKCKNVESVKDMSTFFDL